MTENWRILLALVLTIVVLFGWNFFFAPEKDKQVEMNKQEVQPKQEKIHDVPTKKTEKESIRRVSPETRETDQALSDKTYESTPKKSVTIDTPLYRAEINPHGGILEHFLLKKYDETIKKDSKPIDLITERSLNKAPLGIVWDQEPTWNRGKWELEGQSLRLQGSEQGSISFIGHFEGLTVIRNLTFQADSYKFNEDLIVLNQKGQRIQGSLDITMDSPKLVENESRFNRTNVIYYSSGGLKAEDDTDDLRLGIRSDSLIKWAGIDSNYFLLSMIPKGDMHFKGSYKDKIYQVSLAKKIIIPPQSETQLSLVYYLGPKIKSYLAQAPNNLKAAIHYGWLDIISKPLIEMLNFFYRYVGNYGVAIILLTIVIKILFWPLSHKSYKSMERMKKLQPMMKKLKEDYKDDRQKMNQELMRLYKTYKVNPAGGCLPMILQIPVFIGLYEALLGATELRHASFISHVPFTDYFWLADLSAKDPYYVTPVLMGLTMFLQQKLSPTAGDPMQAKIMLIMPIFLTFIFLNFPSGLVIYFITNNVLSIFQQWLMLRKA